MQRQVAKYTLIIIGLIFVFTGLAASASLSLRITNDQNKAAQVQGTVLAKESSLPLASGTITIDGQTVSITDGNFIIDSITPGQYRVAIEGPYRTQKNTTVTIEPGNNQITFEVPTYVEQAEIDMLARITRAEAEGESSEGRTAVAASVLNRVNSSRYPNTVNAVVYQRISGRYQYSPVRDGRIRLAPRAADYNAAYSALAGNDPSLGATGFYNPAKTRDRWVRSNPVTTRIGGHVFFSY